MLKKVIVIIGIILLAFGFTEAAEKKDVKEKKTTAKSAKCWKRLPPLDKTLMSPEYNTVCKAFEEVLNKTCEPPEKLQCNWTLPKGEKRFKKLEWQPLDWKEYWGLIEDMVLSGWNEKYRAGQWERVEAKVRKEFDDGRRILAVTLVDIDHDGKTEQVVRDDNVPCEGNAGVMFGVMIPESRRVDWKRNNVLDHINSLSEGSEILLYEGKAYMFKIENIYYEPGVMRPSKEVLIYEGYTLGFYENPTRGSINLCRFKYLKGRKRQ